jgi:hypothetical protein
VAYYGIVFPEFWTGTTGRALRAAGRDAQVLALYLATNRHSNMLGLYRVLADDIRHETGLSAKALHRSVTAIQETEFAVYDAGSSFVWVLSMARIRLGLKIGAALDPGDNRTLAVNRIYHAIESNPFLGSFFDVNQKLLRLKKRRESVGVVVALSETTTGRALKGLTKGLVSQITESDQNDQRSDQNDQKQIKARLAPPVADAPRDNAGVIRALIAGLVNRAAPEASFTDLKDAAKEACARLRISYDATVVGAALEQALARRRRLA